LAERFMTLSPWISAALTPPCRLPSTAPEFSEKDA
jgi:hypothetical protein